MILQFILGLQSQSIDFTNTFAQADIPIGDPLFIELPRDLKSYGGQHAFVLKLKINDMVKSKPNAYGKKSCEMFC